MTWLEQLLQAEQGVRGYAEHKKKGREDMMKKGAQPRLYRRGTDTPDVYGSDRQSNGAWEGRS